MRKNIIITTLLSVLIFTSCDNRKDIYYDIDNAPVLKVARIAGVDNTYTTSIEDSLKIDVPYILRYSITSYKNLTVEYEQTSGNDNISIKDNLITIVAKKEGISRINLKVTDGFGKSGSANLEFTVFRNLIPVCNFSATKIGQLSPYEVEIDASESFDRDAKWGGKIVAYEYRLQNDPPILNNLNKIRFIFGSSGQKQITVRVQDNDGDWSDEKTLHIII